MTIAPRIDPMQNHLLASLPNLSRLRLFPLLESCSLTAGKELHKAGQHILHIYFPVDSIISLLSLTLEGNAAEVAVVGNEGAVGVVRFMGESNAHTSAVVHSAGLAYRIPAQAMVAEFDRHSELMVLMLRYIQTKMTQMAQTAVCNRHHRLEQQLCRWLLLSLDRLPSLDLAVTHEAIANLLGVRREGVTEAVGKLHRLGIIAGSRGHIRVLDREQLEDLSCECYSVIRNETQRLHSPFHSDQPLHAPGSGRAQHVAANHRLRPGPPTLPVGAM